MPQLFNNLARALLASGIAAGDTSLTVEAGKADLFPIATTGTGSVPAPSTDWFKLVIQEASGLFEIMYVRTRTAGSAVLSNIIRGQENTIARAWTAGAVCGLRITALDVQNSIAAAANAVLLAGDQAVGGVKTFAQQINASGGIVGNLTGNVAGNVAGNAGTVTNGVYTEGDQTIAGDKTFSTAPKVGTAAAKVADERAASTGFVDRLRSLLASTTTGTAVVSDRGSIVLLGGAFAIPPSIFAAGDVITLYNNTASAISIAQASGMLLRLVGTASTGNRTLAGRGLATIVFISATEAVISGGGLS